MKKSQELEIELIFHPESEVEKHVIFIHGLDGNLFESWKSNNDPSEFWPNWLSEDIHNLAIWTIGYPASKSSWFWGQAMHVTDRGRTLYQAIRLKKELKEGEINLVGHSMGGLLIKQIIREADAEAKSDQAAIDFLERIRKVVFIGTPHAGSFLSSIAKLTRVISRPSAATYSLGKDDPQLRDLNNFYKRIVKEQSISHLILQETQKLSPIKWLPIVSFLVVSPSSSDPGLDEIAIPIDANHETICKPRSKNSFIYQKILDFLSRSSTNKSTRKRVEEKVDKNIELNEKLNEKFDSLTGDSKIVDAKIFDREISKKLTKLKHQRHFGNFLTNEFSETLLRDVTEGELAFGSKNLRSLAIAWCVRVLSVTSSSLDLQGYLDKAAELESCLEVEIAKGFLDAKSESNLDNVISDFGTSSNKIKRSAALILIANKKSITACLSWYKESNFTSSYFDVDGLINLFKFSLYECDWELLEQLIKQEEFKSIDDSPALFHFVALSYLALSTNDLELRKAVYKTLPLGDFPLSSNEKGIFNRRQAISYFHTAGELASAYGLSEASEYNQDFCLWLKLQDSQYKKEAQVELLSSMRATSDLMIRRFPLAINFLEQEIDYENVEQEITALTAKSLGKSFKASLARYAYLINLTKTSKAEEIYLYLVSHKKQIELCAPKEELLGLEIELFVNLGEISKAEERLGDLKKICTNVRVFETFNNIVLEAKGEDPIVLAIEQYKKTSNISDLNILVRLLQRKSDNELLEHYAFELFKRTKNIEHAEILLESKHRMKKFGDIKHFISNRKEYVEQSPVIKVFACWTHFREGNLEECKKLLSAIKDAGVKVMSLEIQLAIAGFDWSSLSTIVEEGWNSREDKDINELIPLANLATVVLPKRAKEFIEYIALKEKQNPNALISAYSIATNMGWEDSEDVSGWLQKAMQLSDSSGPVKSVSLQELVDSLPEWREQENRVMHLFNSMKAPAHIVADSLNRTLTSFYLFPFIINESQQDLRFVQPIPAYSSFRPLLITDAKIVALDATAILTLGKLGILDNVIGYFENIIIPHSLPFWLINELQKSVFHQPSRINNARKISDFVVDKKIVVVDKPDIKNADLSLEVGDNLAALLDLCNSDESGKSLTVRSLPIMKSGSYMQEEADISLFKNKVVECSVVIRSLRKYGDISEEVEAKALAFLNSKEKYSYLSEEDASSSECLNNDDQSEVILKPESKLFLDDLSISYFLTMDLITELVNSSFNIFILDDSAQEHISLLKHEGNTKLVCDVLENIRTSLELGLRNNKIAFTSLNQNRIDNTDKDIELLKDLIVGGEATEGVVFDDRYLNQNQMFQVGAKQINTFTSLDILNTLHVNGVISLDLFRKYISSLRKAQYHFISLTKEELNYWLNKAYIEENRLIESQELGVIRKYLTKLKMSNSMKLPRDADWLLRTMREISSCLKDTWLLDVSIDEKKARSEWLLKLLDYRGWAVFHEEEARLALALNGQAILVNSLMMFFPDNSQTQNEYWQWFCDQVLEPLKLEDPDSFNQVLDFAKQEITRQISDTELWERLEK